MQSDNLTAVVHDSCPDLDAERVAQCTLITLDAIAEHLDIRTAEEVASGLPRESAGAVLSGARRADRTGQPIKIGALLDKVRARTELLPKQAEALTYAVAITVSHMLGNERAALLARTLPKDVNRLFRD